MRKLEVFSVGYKGYRSAPAQLADMWTGAARVNKQQAHPMQNQHMCALWLSNSQTVLHKFMKRGEQDVHCRVIQRGGDLKAIWVPVTR